MHRLDSLLPWLSLVAVGLWPATDLLLANPQADVSSRLILWSLAILSTAATAAAITFMFARSFGRSMAIVAPATVAFFCFAWLEPGLRFALAEVGLDRGAVVAFFVLLGVLVLVLARVSIEQSTRRFLLVIPIFLLSTSGAAALISRVSSTPSKSARLDDHAKLAPKFRTKPNVYHFLFDGLARPDMLRATLGVDVRNDVEQLQQSGLELAPKVQTRYLTTVASISGIFNPFADTTKAQDLVASDTPIIQAFRSQGYHYAHYGEVFAFSVCKGNEDRCLNQPSWKLTELDITLLRKTPLYQLLKKAILAETDSRALLTNLHIIVAEGVKRPTFTFVYMVPPHPPFIFNERCAFDARSAQEFTRWDRAQAPRYVQGYRCVLRAMTSVVQVLIRKDPSAVIIVSGDHGTMFRRVEPSWSAEAIAERRPVFLAFRAPDRCSAQLRNIEVLSNLYPLLMRCL